MLLMLLSSALRAAEKSPSEIWEKDIVAFEKQDQANPPPQGAVLFIGASTIRMWKTLQQDFPGHKVINRGFGGSQIADSTYYADRIVIPYKPAMIVFRAGGNDLNAGKSPEQAFADFKAFVAKVRASLPDVRIAYNSIGPSIARWGQFEKEKALNTLIKDYMAQGKAMDFIDEVDAFLGPDGKPRRELLADDLLHSSPAGYKVRADLVRPFLENFKKSTAAPASTTAVKPNIIFFLLDDMGFMDIGANNPNTFYETPNIDTLAARGMRFTSGYAACPVCSPTRASIMTGKYPPRTGITDFIPGMRNARLKSAPNALQLPLQEVTIAEALRDAGYSNFIAGKWHLGDNAFSPSAQGFDANLVQIAGWYFPQSFAPKPKVDPKFTDRIADDAVTFIQSHKDKPFFAYMPFNAVHVAIGARPDLVEKYQRKKANAPADAWGQERDSKVRLVQNNPVYAAMIEQLDTAIGRVIAAVENAGIAERTMVVFMSDNGGLATAEGHPTSNLPLRAGKGWLYEGGIKEPMIIVAPGVTKPGTVCDTPVISTDFYPTILELCGLPLNPSQHQDGKSMLPLLKGGEFDRGPLFWHYPHYGNQGGAPSGAVRAGEWKLIEWFEDDSVELYNIAADPGEKNNLAAKEPAKTAALRNMLHEWRGRVGAKMPTPNPDFKTDKKPNPENP